MSDRLEEIMADFVNRINNNSDTSNYIFGEQDDMILDKLKQALQSYIDTEIIEARIDELKRLKLSGTPNKMYDILVEVPELTTKNDVGLLSIEDRIKQLRARALNHRKDD